MMAVPAIVGVDLGGTSVRAARVLDGEVLARAARPVPAAAAAGIVLDAVLATAAEVIDDSVGGIGCGVPSVVDVARGIVYSVENIPSWREVPLRQAFEERFRRPAFINNDANAFAVGELHFGAGRACRHMVGITLGTGLGAGVVIDRRLYSGPNCGAGEIGSIPYRDSTVEQYCAGPFFRREAGVGGDVLCARAERGDAEALRVFHAYGRELGHAIMTVLYAYDPELVVLGGSIARAFAFFDLGMRERLRDFVYQHALARVQIVRSELPDAALLGAAALYLDARRREEGR
jgi:glucokinase